MPLIDPSRFIHPDGEGIDAITHWSAIYERLAQLRASAKAVERYNVVYLLRHGEGHHNVQEEQCKTDGDDWDNVVGTWPEFTDPLLTPFGHLFTSLQDANIQIAKAHGFIPPSLVLSSPLTRAWQTGMRLFPEADRFQLDDGMREGISVRTCDRRVSRKDIEERITAMFGAEMLSKTRFGGATLTEGDGEDPIWGKMTETNAEHRERTLQFMQHAMEKYQLFEQEKPFALVGHYGTVPYFLEAFGYKVPPGDIVKGRIVPVVVKITKLPPPPVF